MSKQDFGCDEHPPPVCPVRECKTCGFRTISTSTIDWCPKCKDEDGLRPRHFLTRDKDSDGNGNERTGE